ncbi:MAG: hypothetical protein K6F92_04785 [Lachnospiraceae bacterium]|nr:hypothetical protein [Lachnospiraceae bacterium]
MKKLLKSFFLTIVVCVNLVCTTTYAENIYPDPTSNIFYYTTSGIVGTKTSEDVYPTTSTSLATIGGGDAGVYFHYTSVGLQASFVRDYSRTMLVETWEYDNIISKKHFKDYTGTFGLSNGYYRPCSWSYSTLVNGQIEDNNCAEIYLVWKVNPVSGDSSTSVPAMLLKYQLWVY